MPASEEHARSPLLDVEAEHSVRVCVHCGLCLTNCPTYKLLGAEMDSPRGRIYLLRAMQEGRIEPTDPKALLHLDLCLGCRACESACPSGVPYGEILEAGRAALHPLRQARHPGTHRRLLSMLTRTAVTSRGLLAVAAAGLRVADLLGVRHIVHRGGAIDRWAPRLAHLIRQSPRVMGAPFQLGAASVYPAVGEHRARVAFFTGCVMDAVMGDIHRDTIRLLNHQGVEVVVPGGQTCCGALHSHLGEEPFALELARRNVDALAALEVDAVVNNSAGCGAHMKTYGRLLRDDPERAAAAEELSARTVDVTRFLVDLGLRSLPENGSVVRVAYDAPCHLHHAQKETEAPLEFLRAIPGLEVTPLPDSEDCCGAAGSYALTQPEMSEAVFSRKVESVWKAAPDAVATGNPGCLIQFQQGLAAAGLDVRVVHPVQLAAERYPNGQS